MGVWSGPGGIRTRGLFSAMDKNAGEMAKIAVITSTIDQNHHAVSAYLYPNCTRSVPDIDRYEAR
jgi:hypothetical protein